MTFLLNRRQLAAAAIGTAITALSFTAIAQGSMPAAPAQPSQAATPAQPHPHAKAPGQRHDPQAQAERQQRFQKRLADQQSRLKDSLQLRPEQESAWKDFVSQTQPAARPAGERPSREQWAQLNTPQRLDRLDAMKAERDAQVKQRHDGIRRFYSQLTPSQQKAFDAQRGLSMGMQPAGHHHGPMGHGPRGGSRPQRG